MADNPDGEIRRVGVEIEFAGVNVVDAAEIVRTAFGGQCEQESVHRIFVENTPFGTFGVELDAQIVHKGPDPLIEPVENIDIEGKSREALGHVISAIVPTEIVCPPIPWNRLDRLHALFDDLRAGGAEGSDGGLLYGFGLHLNPEVAEQSASYALRHLQAYVILEDWLRDSIGIAPIRRVLPHIDPFPRKYIRKILDSDYAPSMRQLIEDYIAGNPTRNRGLDMLPLFRHLDAATVEGLLEDVTLVKPRPTFHYRLPNAQLLDRNWGPVTEWNRWLEVETLAHDTELLDERKAEYVDWLDKPITSRWLDRIVSWLSS